MTLGLCPLPPRREIDIYSVSPLLLQASYLNEPKDLIFLSKYCIFAAELSVTDYWPLIIDSWKCYKIISLNISLVKPSR